MKRKINIGIMTIIFLFCSFMITYQIKDRKSKDEMEESQTKIHDDAPEAFFVFENAVQKVWSDYKNGNYGSELYYIASTSGTGWSGKNDIVIYKSGDIVTIIYYQSNGRYKMRQLSNDEIRKLESFIENNSIDQLKDLKRNDVSDGIEYQYMHFSNNKKTTFYINNPDIKNVKNIYSELVHTFFDLTEVGNFDVNYISEEMKDSIKILLKREDYYVESVWKYGNDFRVLIKDLEKSDYWHNELNWFKFENGEIGMIVDEPEGLVMQNPWGDIPITESVTLNGLTSLKGFELMEHLNSYTWQAKWKSYYIRSLRKYDGMVSGLWLTKADEEPKLISKGSYANPIAIPESDWVICEKAVGSWANPHVLVKINLNTFEETVIDLSADNYMKAVTIVDGKLLISKVGEDYLYDIK